MAKRPPQNPAEERGPIPVERIRRAWRKRRMPRRVDPGAARVALALLLRSTIHGAVGAERYEIAFDAGVSQPTADRALAALHKAGWIDKGNDGKPGRRIDVRLLDGPAF